MPRFSVIVATHRRPQLLARALDSLLTQSYPCHQILVISDVADEATWRVCSERLRAHDRFLERGGPSGPAPSRNLGIDLADGDYVLFLDDDDIFRPAFLEHLAAQIARQPAPAIFYTNCEVIHGDDPAAEALAVDLSGFTVDTIFIKNFIPNNCLAFPRAALEGVRFDPEIAYEDWEFILSAVARAGLRHLPVSGPVIFKNAVPGVAGRGVNNRPRVIECYRRIYRKHPAANPAIAEGRRQFVLASGIEVDAEGLPVPPPAIPADFLPPWLPQPGAPIRVGVYGADPARSPWRELRDWGAPFGLLVEFPDGPADGLDALLVLDRPAGIEAVLAAWTGGPATACLVVEASPVSAPEVWDGAYQGRFGQVLTWNDALVDGGRYLKWAGAWLDARPVFDPDAVMQRFFERRLAMLCAPAGASTHPQELYSHRLRTVRWFENEAPDDFSLYGEDWGESFPSWRGDTAAGREAFAGHRFAICYEEAQGYTGLLGPALLASLQAGCVPVYGGAPNVGDWLPEDCYLPVAAFATYADLHATLRAMPPATYHGYLRRIAAFLAGEGQQRFSLGGGVGLLFSLLAHSVRMARGESLQPFTQDVRGRPGSAEPAPPDRSP